MFNTLPACDARTSCYNPSVNNSRLVYSTDAQIIGNRKPSASGQERAPSKAPPPGFPNDGIVRISREKGNRGGKTVTMIRGLPETGDKLVALSTELKRSCGAGGTVRDGAIEIQGDHRERLAEKLTSLGLQGEARRRVDRPRPHCRATLSRRAGEGCVPRDRWRVRASACTRLSLRGHGAARPKQSLTVL